MNLTTDQASALARRVDAASALRPSLADRYARIRPEMERRTALPVAGAGVEKDLRNLDDTMRWLDDNAAQVQDASATLARRAAGGPVEIPDGLFDRVNSWIGAVGDADEILKRYEGLAVPQAPEQAAPQPLTQPAGIPWGLVAVGVGLVGVAVWLLVD